MDGPSLEVFQVGPEGVISNLLWWEMSLATAGSWNWTVFGVPFDPDCSGVL